VVLMDVASLALSLISMQAGNTQQQIATSVLKSNLDAEKSSVLTLLGGGSSSLANVGPGVGGNLNISA
jgi:Putative motility protein